MDQTQVVFAGDSELERMKIDNENIIFYGNKSVTVPIGDTSERPASPEDGMIRFNNQTNKYEGYVTGTGWVDFH